MPKNVRIGTCGFGSTKAVYAENFSTVEIQTTFYQPPQVKTLEKWRSEMPDEFEFVLKAWQLITHECTSPTFRRLKRKLSENEALDAGFFKPTAIVQEALDYTLACADALQARTVLFQCPAKFLPTEENIENLKNFVRGIDRPDLNFGWEPRGAAWSDSTVKGICEELGLWHVVDPFSRPTMTPENCYYRLHGHPRWRYTYEDVELEELVYLLPDERLSYVFFNNVTMRDDAWRFEKVVREAEVQARNL